MSRITSDVGSLLIFLNSSSLHLVSDLALAAGICVALVWLNWKLALVSFVAVPLYAVNHQLFARKVRELSRRVRAQVAAIYALLSERVSAVRVVRSFAQEEKEVAELDARIDEHRALGWSGMRVGALQGALAVLISGLGTVAVLVYGVCLARAGSLSVGELLAFYTLLAQFYNPVVRLTQFHGTAAGTLAAVERIAEVLEEPETLTDRPNARPVRRPRGALAFHGVTFAYRPGGPRVLERVELEVEPGMKVGILGPAARARAPCWRWHRGCTTCPKAAGPCCSTAATSASIGWPTCVGGWRWCPSRRSCSRERSTPT
jgi:ABC-type multidrug transport system fused ATPase/permease subunit